MVPAPGDNPLTWRSALPEHWHCLQITFHTWTGPGGVVVRCDDGPCTSAATLASRGLEACRTLDIQASEAWEVMALG